jgi:hypothetical protein
MAKPHGIMGIEDDARFLPFPVTGDLQVGYLGAVMWLDAQETGKGRRNTWGFDLFYFVTLNRHKFFQPLY